MSLLPQQILPQTDPIGTVLPDGKVQMDVNWWLFFYNISKDVLGINGSTPTAIQPLLFDSFPDPLTAQAIGQQVYPITAAEIAAGVNPLNYQYPPGYVDRYGTNQTPGTTNMVAAITAAFAQAVSGGASIVFQNATYFVGNISNVNTKVFTVTGLSNCTIYGNNAVIACNSTYGISTGQAQIFWFVNCSGLTFFNLGCSDAGFDITQTYQGADFISFVSTDAVDRLGYTFIGCHFKNMVTPIAFSDIEGGTGRMQSIKIAGCTWTNCYNGPSFQSQGDYADIDATMYNCLRNYFPYGVAGHKASLHIYAPSNSAGANACIDIKRYDRDTRDISVRADFHGFTSAFGSLVNLETQTTAGTASITALGTITGGSLYTAGTYWGVPLTGGTGTGASAQITVVSGAVTSVFIMDPGTGYLSTDTLSAAATNIGGTGSGFSVPVSAVGGIIDGIDIDLHLSDAQIANDVAPGIPLQIRSIAPNGSTNSTTTDRYDRISLRGNMGQWPWGQLGSPQVISVASVPTGVPLGRISVDPGLFDAFNSQRPQVYPGFIIKRANDEYFLSELGDLTATPLYIDLSEYAGRFWFLKILIAAESDYSFASNQQFTEYAVNGFVNQAGTSSIGNTAQIFTQTSGGTSCLSATPFTASGSGITITFTNYNSANSTARVHVRHCSRLL